MLEAEFVALIDALPTKKFRKAKWHPTKHSPCACVMVCTRCNDAFPIDHFYPIQNENGRRDITGARRNSICKACSNLSYVKQEHRLKLWRSAKLHAKEKGVPFTISVEDIVIPEFCPVLGMKLCPKVGQGRQNRHSIGDSPTIDRVDNTRGYEPGNICVISGRANHLKSNGTAEEIEAVLNYIRGFQRVALDDATNHRKEVGS